MSGGSGGKIKSTQNRVQSLRIKNRSGSRSQELRTRGRSREAVHAKKNVDNYEQEMTKFNMDGVTTEDFSRHLIRKKDQASRSRQTATFAANT